MPPGPCLLRSFCPWRRSLLLFPLADAEEVTASKRKKKRVKVGGGMRKTRGMIAEKAKGPKTFRWGAAREGQQPPPQQRQQAMCQAVLSCHERRKPWRLLGGRSGRLPSQRLQHAAWKQARHVHACLHVGRAPWHSVTALASAWPLLIYAAAGVHVSRDQHCHLHGAARLQAAASCCSAAHVRPRLLPSAAETFLKRRSWRACRRASPLI